LYSDQAGGDRFIDPRLIGVVNTAIAARRAAPARPPAIVFGSAAGFTATVICPTH
jgi:hypothetical protein